MKYQFCIRFSAVDANSAASKAVLDCNKILMQHDYHDFTFTVPNNANRAKYYVALFKNMLLFFLKIRSGSFVCVQYPLLSINNVFRYFIKLTRLKKVQFFCIVHDLHSLRVGGKDEILIKKDIDNLNMFKQVIVHNIEMLEWLNMHGLQRNAILLEVFDYLSDKKENSYTNISNKKTIVYAGNLVKSEFIYGLDAIKNCNFNLYGPGYNKAAMIEEENVKWMGVYSPEEIPQKLLGNFGLIWDGAFCSNCDELMGNYLKYNAPHKFSLYIAAGLPVIAPLDSAIGVFIKANNIGFLIESIFDLERIHVNQDDYDTMKQNVLSLRKKITKGEFFSKALVKAELELACN